MATEKFDTTISESGDGLNSRKQIKTNKLIVVYIPVENERVEKKKKVKK